MNMVVMMMMMMMMMVKNIFVNHILYKKVEVFSPLCFRGSYIHSCLRAFLDSLPLPSSKVKQAK